MFIWIHKVTVWKSMGIDRYSQPKWSEPIVTDARWEDTSRIFLNAEGREMRSNSTVYLKEDIAVPGDMIIKGVSTSQSPDPESKEVKSRRETPDLRGTEVEYRVLV